MKENLNQKLILRSESLTCRTRFNLEVIGTYTTDQGLILTIENQSLREQILRYSLTLILAISKSESQNEVSAQANAAWSAAVDVKDLLYIYREITTDSDGRDCSDLAINEFIHFLDEVDYLPSGQINQSIIDMITLVIPIIDSYQADVLEKQLTKRRSIWDI